MRTLSIITLGAAMMLLSASLGGCASMAGSPSSSAQLARPNYAPHSMRGTVRDPRFMGSARGGEGYIHNNLNPNQE